MTTDPRTLAELMEESVKWIGTHCDDPSCGDVLCASRLGARLSSAAAELRGMEPILWLVVPDGRWSQRQGPYETKEKAEQIANELLDRADTPCHIEPLYAFAKEPADGV